ncbi:MAG: hypothetical protein NG784_09140 [Candidatus Jettenia sp.]|nr:hypothetical protein [Candidatus Jettenia sp.]
MNDWEKEEVCECFEKEGLGKLCQGGYTGIVNSLSSFRNERNTYISPFFKGESRGIKMLQLPGD